MFIDTCKLEYKMSTQKESLKRVTSYDLSRSVNKTFAFLHKCFHVPGNIVAASTVWWQNCKFKG